MLPSEKVSARGGLATFFFFPSSFPLPKIGEAAARSAIGSGAPRALAIESDRCPINRTASAKTRPETMSATEVANAFVAHFYGTRDSNIDALAGLYVRVGRLSLRLSRSIFERPSSPRHWLLSIRRL